MAILTKKEMLKKIPLKQELVSIPEWGGDVLVQEMTAIQRDQFEDWVLKKNASQQEGEDDVKGTRVQIVINTVVDENGKQVFCDLDAVDLGLKPARIIGKIASVGLRLSGMDEEAEKEQAKKSETDQKEDSILNSVES